MAKLNSLSDLRFLFPEAEGAYNPEPETRKQNLEAHFSNKGRGGKTVTVIKGFVGSNDDLKTLSKILKTKCGVGGTAKNSEIIIQGNVRDKVIDILEERGYNYKRVGG